MTKSPEAVVEKFDSFDDEIRRFIGELHEFHGQKVYEFVGPAIAKKKTHMRFFFLVVSYLSSWQWFNMLALIAAVAFYRIFRFPVAGSRVFQFGSSKNNVKSLNRLRKVLEAGEVSGISLNGIQLSIRDRLKALSSLTRVRTAARVITENMHVTPLAHTQTLLGCAALLVYLSRPFPSCLKVICVASDHSPICMALLYVGRRRNIKTCYIQHAPVTQYFPPLRHDLSILFDRASALSYERAAAERGLSFTSSIVLLSPFENEFQRPILQWPIARVGVCLSFLPELDFLVGLIKQISAEKCVEEIVLRPHPRCRLDLSDLLAIKNVRIQRSPCSADSFFEDVDLVLVPNSGVAIESLHHGRPTFYVSGMDQIKTDYYGFVEAKVIPVLQKFDLSALWGLRDFFDDSWVDRYHVYDETVHGSVLLAETKILEKFEIFLNETIKEYSPS